MFFFGRSEIDDFCALGSCVSVGGSEHLWGFLDFCDTSWVPRSVPVRVRSDHMTPKPPGDCLWPPKPSNHHHSNNRTQGAAPLRPKKNMLNYLQRPNFAAIFSKIVSNRMLLFFEENSEFLHFQWFWSSRFQSKNPFHVTKNTFFIQK